MTVATVLLLLPTFINMLIPDKAMDYKQLSIDAFGSEWQIPITTAEGASVQCELDADDFISRTWQCRDSTTITTQFVEGVDDPENTLRRMIRATNGFSPGNDAHVGSSNDGRAHILSDDARGIVPWAIPTIALSLDGSGDEEGKTAVVIISGDAASYYSSAIWGSMAQERGVPYSEELPLAGAGTGEQNDETSDDFDQQVPPLDRAPQQGLLTPSGNEDV